MPPDRRDDVFSPAESRAIRDRLNRPPEERFADLVRAGVIDAAGNVLVRMPSARPAGRGDGIEL